MYPALVVLQEWLTQQNTSADDLLWVGSEGDMEAGLVARAGVPFTALPAGGLRGMGPVQQVRNAFKIARGILSAFRLLRAFEPDVLFATGGYACVATTLAAWLRRVPVLMYLPDVVPGLAIRRLSRLARRVAVTCEEAAQHLPTGTSVVTGYPVRPELASLSREEARQRLRLPGDASVVLVFGGSRGARSLNQAVLGCLPDLLGTAHLLHVSGTLDAARVQQATRELPAPLRARYHLFEYLHDEMAAALVAADLVVARAGAATLGEFPAVGLPSVLVPYPYSGRHQQANAEYLARSGAARIVADEDLGSQLWPVVHDLLDDPSALDEMARAARTLARPRAASRLVEELQALAREPDRRQGVRRR